MAQLGALCISNLCATKPLIKQNQISVNCKLEAVALWIVYEKPISSIIEINSIQFLLALDSWKKRVQFFGLKPRVYISQHIK
ncbi:hypothetical protein [Acinetobacter johnsonii]|uniref:hypothetical protein n=1 Tax=Acinetobacter johnsonii TaxID=40214 RepID=UPI002E0EAD3D|nr:hypothetical protein U0040_11945 [Acinetobacter johnsonii]